jgi:transcriptional regulator with XRE-family HTH domain
MPQDWDEAERKEWQIDMGKRLREVIKGKYGYRKEYLFAKDIGISQGSLSEIISGISTPSALTLLKIMENTDINVNYILRG